MSLSLDLQNPWKKWTPTDQISFEKLKEIYPTIEDGDYVLEQKETYSHRFWAFYKPEAGGYYAHYALGFSGDSKSIFYHQKKCDPIIIKSDDKNLIILLKKQLSPL